MNESELEFKAGRGGTSQEQRLQALFESRPHEWIAMTDLGRELGCWAVHSRVAGVRRRVREAGGDVENAVRVEPETGQRHSFYRYVPPAGGLERN